MYVELHHIRIRFAFSHCTPSDSFRRPSILGSSSHPAYDSDCIPQRHAVLVYFREEKDRQIALPSPVTQKPLRSM